MASTIGVIIATVGNRASLGAAFGSVVTQTRRPDAIRIVCDCHDRSDVERWCDLSYAIGLGIDAQFVMTGATPQASVGESRARNIGIETLRTDYVAFLDDDDLWLPRHLELLELCGGGDTGVIPYARSVRLSGGSKVVVWPAGNGYTGRVPWMTTLHGYPANHTTSLFPRVDLEAVGGYDASLARTQDVDLLVRLGDRCEFRFVDDVTHVIFRRAGESTVSELVIESRRALFQKHDARMTPRERAKTWHHLALSAWNFGCVDQAVDALRYHTTRTARFAPTWTLRAYLRIRTDRRIVAKVKRLLGR